MLGIPKSIIRNSILAVTLLLGVASAQPENQHTPGSDQLQAPDPGASSTALICFSDFCSNYGQSRTHNISVDSGTYSFEVDVAPCSQGTEWYVNGSYQPPLDCGCTDPSFSRSFSSGTTIIEAVVFYLPNCPSYSNGHYEETHRWNVTIGRPDLVAQSASVNDTTVNPGQSVTVSWTARNIGTGSAGSTQQGVMWSTNSTISRSDRLLEREFLGSLGAGGSTPESHTITIPTDAVRGQTYYLGAYADFDLDETELSESNNGSNGVAVTINALPRPDLVAQNASVNDTTVDPGQSVTVSWTARNIGTGSAGSTQQGVMWSTNSTISRSDRLLEREFLGSLGAGGSTPESHTITIPTDAVRGQTYYLGAYADFDLDETELSESNNGSNGVAVTFNALPRPDLVAQNASVNDTTVDPGQSATVSWTARNIGTGSAGSTQQGVMWSSNSSISRSDRLLEREFLGSIGAGDSTPESHTVRVPTDAVLGQTYYIGVYADYDLDEAELSETNNDSNGVAVTINHADLVLADILMDGQTNLPSVRSGDAVRLDFDACNQGTATTIASVHKCWYWGTSPDSTANLIDCGSKGIFNGLSPGECERETDASWTIPQLNPGTYWLTAWIDWDNRVPESDESNNKRSESFEILPPPNRPPDRPGTLSASSVTRTSATVSWGISGDPDGDTITYEVEYKKDLIPFLWTSAGTTSSTSRPLSGLEEDTTYDVRVRAFDGDLYSEWRDQENVIITLANQPPSTPGAIVVSNQTTDGVTICWSSSVDPEGDAISYELQRRPNLEPLWLGAGQTTGNCSSLTGLLRCWAYDVRVRATDSFGDPSSWRTDSFSTLCPTSFRGNHFVNKSTAQGVAILLDAKLELDAGFFIPNFDIKNQDVSFEMRVGGQWSCVPEDGVTATRLKTDSDGIASIIYLPPEDMTPDSYPIRAVFASTNLLEGTTLERVLTITERTYYAFPEPIQSERTPLVLIHGINSEDKPESMYRWQIFKDQLGSFPEVANRLDVIVWRHESNAPVGFNGNTGNAAELADFIYGPKGGLLSKYAPGTKVLLLAHSRGGLVARSFMNYQNQGDDVLGLITLGTPHHGSPLAVPDWVGYTWTRLFGADFQAAFCFNQMMDTEPLECCGFEVVTVGNLNLAWDNLDSKVSVSNTFAFDVHIATDGFLNITTNDVNRSGNILDSTLIYTNSYKSQFGTLYDLNIGFAERYKAKIVTFAAYDDQLIDNNLLFGSVLGPLCALVPPLSDDSQVVEARTTEFLKHQGLRMVQPLMAAMSILPDGSGVYYANDGFVPIQSALFLDTSGGLPFSSNILGFVGIDEENIASRRQVARHHIFNNRDHGVADHLDLLDTDNDSYWSTLAAEIRSFVVGDIFVSACPAEVSAPWTLTGPDTQLAGNGELFVTDMSPGDYTIVWGQVSGWERPSPNPETKLLLAGGILTFGGTAPDGCYEPSEGRLQVYIDPSEADLDGACWRLTSGPDTNCYQSGHVIGHLPVDAYTVVFEGTDCWQPPVPQFVTIEFDQKTFATGIYTGTDCRWLDQTCVFGSCSSALGGCFEEPFNEGGLCDDGVSCTDEDRCSNGTCSGVADPEAGECSLNEECDDGNPCTDGVCIDSCCTYINNSDPCDAPDICTVADRCIAGICTGDLLDCSHLDTLCARGECNGVTGECVAVPDNEGGSCNDLDFCTLLDRCSAGECIGDLIDCQDQDGEYCNGVETCLDGICVPGVPPDCRDAIGCTVDSCNEAEDKCDNDPDDTLCDNNRYCDGAEWCDPVFDCQDGVRPCPLDECCDEATQTCGPGDPCVDDSECDDGEFCNGFETCTDECCQPGPAPNCADVFECTEDSCDELNDVCLNIPDDNRCASDLYCDGIRVCDPEQGCITQSARCGTDQCCLEQCEECAANSTGHGALLYASSKNASSVALFDAITGEALSPLVHSSDGGLDYANGIAISPHTGNLLIASVRTSSIKEYQRPVDGCRGDYIQDFATGIVASGIAFGPDGKLYVTDFPGNRVIRYDGATGTQDPSYEASACNLRGPTGLLFTASGDLLVGSENTDSVILFDSDTGESCELAASDCELDGPVGMVFRPNGNLLVSSFQTNAIIEFDLSQENLVDRCVGPFVSPRSCGLDGPQGIALGWNGNVFVASLNSDEVLEFDIDDGSSVAQCVFASTCGLDGPTYLAFEFECVTDEDCDDGNACTADSCAEAFCTNTPVNCADTDPCTTDSCDPATGCTHTRLDPCCGSSDLCCGVVCTDGQTCDPDTGVCVPCTVGSDCERFHPADMSPYCGCLSSSCQDNRLDGCEILAYARAWVNGEHDEGGVALRGAFIWKQCDPYTWNAETETWDPNCD